MDPEEKEIIRKYAIIRKISNLVTLYNRAIPVLSSIISIFVFLLFYYVPGTMQSA